MKTIATIIFFLGILFTTLFSFFLLLTTRIEPLGVDLLYQIKALLIGIILMIMGIGLLLFSK